MTEQLPQLEQDKWAEAEARVADVVVRKYPDAKDTEALVQTAKESLLRLKESPTLKFVETVVDGHSFKTIEPYNSETLGEGLPVEDVVDYIGFGDSQEFEFGIPDPKVNADYLQTLSNNLEKPIDAYLQSNEVVHIQPQELASV